MPANSGARYYVPGVPVYYVYPVPFGSTSPSSSSTSSSYIPSSPHAWSRTHAHPSVNVGLESPRLGTIPLPNVEDDVPRRTTRRRSHIDHRPESPAAAPTQELPLSLHAPSIDPLLALPPRPHAPPRIQWDIMYDPTTALLENSSLSQADLRRTAIRASARGGGQPLQALVLIFPLLPMQIEVAPSRPSALGVTLWDVLQGLYRGLRAPVTPGEFMALDDSGQKTLLRAAEMRSRCVPEDAHARDALRRIDYLSRRRCFLGIRPAFSHELPKGRRLGEVFVVEVGTGET